MRTLIVPLVPPSYCTISSDSVLAPSPGTGGSGTNPLASEGTATSRAVTVRESNETVRMTDLRPLERTTQPEGVQRFRQRSAPGMAKIAVLTFGTRGDIQPFVAVSAALKDRGHDVAMMSPKDHTRFIEQSGIRPINYPIDVRETFETPSGRHMLANGQLGAFMRLMMEVTNKTMHEVVPICVAAVDGADLL